MNTSQQPVLFAQRKPKANTTDLFISVFFDLCGIAILMGFFIVPFIQLDATMRGRLGISHSELSAFQMVNELTREYDAGQLFDDLGRGNLDSLFTFPQVAPAYALYVFVIIAILLFFRSLGSLMRFILQNPDLQSTFSQIIRRKQRIHFIPGLIRLITTPFIFAGIPLAVLAFFYLMVINRDPITIQITRLDDLTALIDLPKLQSLIEQYPPALGGMMMIVGCIVGTALIMLTTLGGMFRRIAPATIPQPIRTPEFPPTEEKPAMGAYTTPPKPQREQYSPKQPIPQQVDPIGWDKRNKSDI